MKVDKQQLVLYIMSQGRYRVDFERGVLQSFRRDGEWADVIPNTLPSKRKQHVITHEGTKVMVYLHILVYIAKNGTYKEGKVIDHEDSDPGNCALSNLRLVTHKKNIKYSLKNRAPKREGDNRQRGEVITKIREALKDGKNQTQIARELGLKRLGVRYVVKQIEAGKTLKFEAWEDMTKQEVAAEALPSLTEKFKI
jgi:hypothetical protein